jgi:hypothetical protein
MVMLSGLKYSEAALKFRDSYVQELVMLRDWRCSGASDAQLLVKFRIC